VPATPGEALTEVGDAEMVKSGAATAFMVTLTVVEWLSVSLVPVTVTV
jgi:hypothetical protein